MGCSFAGRMKAYERLYFTSGVETRHWLATEPDADHPSYSSWHLQVPSRAIRGTSTPNKGCLRQTICTLCQPHTWIQGRRPSWPGCVCRTSTHQTSPRV